MTETAQAAPRATAQPVPTPGRGPALIGLAAATIATADTWAVTATVFEAAAGGWRWVLGGAALAGAAAVLLVYRPALDAWRSSGRCAASADPVERRALAARARESAWTASGLAFAVLCALALLVFVLANDAAVQRTFLQSELIATSALDIVRAFGTNLFIAVVAQALVLVWGLVLALARLAPGRVGRPIRALAIVYIDVIRAVPAIIVIYLIGFGLPIAEVPILSGLSQTWYAILALTIVYGAYVAEVFRSGIESVHPSQVSASRSLGFSHLATMRHVVVPQATKRVIPPLLNDFISLQKDTALVNVIGTIDAFNQAKIFSSNHFNLSSVTVVAALFILITIPQARLVDRLIARDKARGA
ncbi:amino acid ABC transporter permease [Rhizohabitans arisaemae]|uniref:amino acid ABC transporter permease n=1 Tax=Rhizohabitans arisaemae TaxID=2720610 RepID=UPI0024B26527|nr:amino acid ABC transporter permease [Rhizohabitans arisaemae]